MHCCVCKCVSVGGQGPPFDQLILYTSLVRNELQRISVKVNEAQRTNQSRFSVLFCAFFHFFLLYFFYFFIALTLTFQLKDELVTQRYMHTCTHTHTHAFALLTLLTLTVTLSVFKCSQMSVKYFFFAFFLFVCVTSVPFDDISWICLFVCSLVCWY